MLPSKDSKDSKDKKPDDEPALHDLLKPGAAEQKEHSPDNVWMDDLDVRLVLKTQLGVVHPEREFFVSADRTKFVYCLPSGASEESRKQTLARAWADADKAHRMGLLGDKADIIIAHCSDSHWTYYKIPYNFGNSPPEVAVAFVEANQTDSIKYQKNGWSCGDWTVAGIISEVQPTHPLATEMAKLNAPKDNGQAVGVELRKQNKKIIQGSLIDENRIDKERVQTILHLQIKNFSEWKKEDQEKAIQMVLKYIDTHKDVKKSGYSISISTLEKLSGIGEPVRADSDPKAAKELIEKLKNANSLGTLQDSLSAPEKPKHKKVQFDAATKKMNWADDDLEKTSEGKVKGLRLKTLTKDEFNLKAKNKEFSDHQDLVLKSEYAAYLAVEAAKRNPTVDLEKDALKKIEAALNDIKSFLKWIDENIKVEEKKNELKEEIKYRIQNLNEMKDSFSPAPRPIKRYSSEPVSERWGTFVEEEKLKIPEGSSKKIIEQIEKIKTGEALPHFSDKVTVYGDEESAKKACQNFTSSGKHEISIAREKVDANKFILYEKIVSGYQEEGGVVRSPVVTKTIQSQRVENNTTVHKLEKHIEKGKTLSSLQLAEDVATDVANLYSSLPSYCQKKSAKLSEMSEARAAMWFAVCRMKGIQDPKMAPGEKTPSSKAIDDARVALKSWYTSVTEQSGPVSEKAKIMFAGVPDENLKIEPPSLSVEKGKSKAEPEAQGGLGLKP
ncbi:MAG: hypothetical protein SFW66_08175 [Gammaproteobacteria bacterium]|nr:hypothetical protein [Gammaproteobacteria bacterium]